MQAFVMHEHQKSPGQLLDWFVCGRRRFALLASWPIVDRVTFEEKRDAACGLASAEEQLRAPQALLRQW
jgi:hypothetical protein